MCLIEKWNITQVKMLRSIPNHIEDILRPEHGRLELRNRNIATYLHTSCTKHPVNCLATMMIYNKPNMLRIHYAYHYAFGTQQDLNEFMSSTYQKFYYSLLDSSSKTKKDLLQKVYR